MELKVINEQGQEAAKLQASDVLFGRGELSGADAANFEIVGTELFLRAGTVLDFEVDPSFDVVVEVDDATLGATPDDTAAHTLNITDVNEAPTVALTNIVTSLTGSVFLIGSVFVSGAFF